MSSVVIFCVLIFVKIYQLAKLIDSNSQTLADAKRASIYCILQAFLAFINLFTSLFIFFFIEYFDYEPFKVFEDAFIVVYTMVDVIFISTSICDSLITLTVLKTYRYALGKILKGLARKVFGKREIQPIQEAVTQRK
jgi:hypothetical protein